MQGQLQPTFNILHDHAQVPPCLKGAEHRHHERVFSKGENVPLHKHLLDLVPQHQVLPVDLLHGKPLTSLLVPHQKHSPAQQEIDIQQVGLKGKSSLEILSINTKILRRHILILVSFLLLLGSLWCQRDWLSGMSTKESVSLTHRRHC